jgi:hypothetical protein
MSAREALMLVVKPSDGEAESAEEATAAIKARQICSCAPDPVALSVAALGWFRAQRLYTHYWLNRALKDSKPKKQNAIPLSSNKKTFFTTLTETRGVEQDPDVAQDVCLALLLDRSNMDKVFGSSRDFLLFVAKCCSSPNSTEKAVEFLRQFKARYMECK